MTATLATLNQQRQAKGLAPLTEADVEFALAVKVCRGILVKLQLVAEGGTGVYRHDSIVRVSGPWICQRCDTRNPGRTLHCSACHNSRPVSERGAKSLHDCTSEIPAGVRLDDGDRAYAPSKTFSLWGHYSYRMERAVERRDTGTLLKLAGCATRDYELHYHLRPSYHENHDAAVTELLRDCRGVPAIEAAWQLGAPVKWVKRQRVLHGHDGEFGEPKRHDDRTRKILELHEQGRTQQQIADEVGLTRQRIQQIVSGA